MNSDLLRIILFILGVLLVLGIYLWDRYRRNAHRRPVKVRRAQHVEPSLDDGGWDDPRTGDADPLDPPAPEKEDVELPPGEFVGEPVVVHRWDTPAEESDSQLSMDLEFSAQGESDYRHLDPALADEVPRLIVQVILLSKEGEIEGSRIRDALDSVDMRFGAMDIYHRENGSGQALFSLASVVEPGSFPARRDKEFTTPGLVLFTQLPGVQDGLSIYSDMLFTAERLAALLNAELHDDSRSVLTRQTIEHMREKILEHRNQVQLLRRKR